MFHGEMLGFDMAGRNSAMRLMRRRSDIMANSAMNVNSAAEVPIYGKFAGDPYRKCGYKFGGGSLLIGSSDFIANARIDQRPTRSRKV